MNVELSWNFSIYFHYVTFNYPLQLMTMKKGRKRRVAHSFSRGCIREKYFYPFRGIARNNAWWIFLTVYSGKQWATPLKETWYILSTLCRWFFTMMPKTTKYVSFILLVICVLNFSVLTRNGLLYCFVFYYFILESSGPLCYAVPLMRYYNRPHNFILNSTIFGLYFGF